MDRAKDIWTELKTYGQSYRHMDRATDIWTELQTCDQCSKRIDRATDICTVLQTCGKSCRTMDRTPEWHVVLHDCIIDWWTVLHNGVQTPELWTRIQSGRQDLRLFDSALDWGDSVL